MSSMFIIYNQKKKRGRNIQKHPFSNFKGGF
nr:MAG TPA: hypothetical protein [Caudoviricetes sp.]